MVKKWGQRIYLAVIFLFLYLTFLVLKEIYIKK